MKRAEPGTHVALRLSSGNFFWRFDFGHQLIAAIGSEEANTNTLTKLKVADAKTSKNVFFRAAGCSA